MALLINTYLRTTELRIDVWSKTLRENTLERDRERQREIKTKIETEKDRQREI